ncbi:hypothetical protein Q5O89_17040 [Peribacillus frigoritolerans]|nr:hypothetical protein [Peribacillus frigoritolerans]
MVIEKVKMMIKSFRKSGQKNVKQPRQRNDGVGIKGNPKVVCPQRIMSIF